MDVARRSEGVEHLHVAHGEAGETEQRQPLREIDRGWFGAEPGARRAEALRRAGRAEAVTQAPPQRGLPGDVVR